MKKLIVLYSLSLLFVASCTNEETDNLNQDTPPIRDTEMADSIFKFYEYYAKIVRNPVENDPVVYSPKMNVLWDYFLSKEKIVMTFVLQEGEKHTGRFYGAAFDSILPLVTTLPNKIHALFWIEALSRKDFLFGRRIVMGNSLFPYIQNPVSVFPVFESNDQHLPLFIEVDTFDYKSFMSVRPDFHDEVYSRKIDSLFYECKDKFERSGKLEGTGVKWFSYEDKFFDKKFVHGLPNDILGH